MVKQEEISYLKALAEQVAIIAASPEMKACRKRWRDVYMLRKPDRAPVWCRATACMDELLPEKSLQCQSELYRSIERDLRWMLVSHSLGDDSIILPYWNVTAVLELEGDKLWGVPVHSEKIEKTRSVCDYDHPVNDYSDLKKLKMPEWCYNEKKNRIMLEQHEEIFADIMPVKISISLPLSAGLGKYAAQLVGLENLFLNLALKPDMMHQLFAFLQKGVLKSIDDLEEMGILTENNDQQIHFSESLKQTSAKVPVKAADLWCRTESQQFDLVSPDMWHEFILEYQLPIMERFKYVSYGCCENLTAKIDGVLSISNLRIFVNGPWTDLETAAEKCRDRYCIIWRQNASKVIFENDLKKIQTHLDKGMEMTQGCYRAIVLQELMTTNANPQRLNDWATMAVKAAEKYS